MIKMLTLNSLAQEQEMAKEFRRAKNYVMHQKSSHIQILQKKCL